MRNRHWWQLTEAEVARRNPPMQVHVFDENDNEWESVIYHEDWQPVGYIPRPRTRLGWFMYHLIHGLAMRYPWWKVLGFAFANTNPGTIDMTDWAAEYEEYVRWSDIEGHEYQPMSFEDFVEWVKGNAA